MKIFLIFLVAMSFIFVSCSDNRTFEIDGKTVVVPVYGWADSNELKRDDINYKVCVGNVVWSFITFETVFVPVILTGYYLFEPVSVKQKK